MILFLKKTKHPLTLFKDALFFLFLAQSFFIHSQTKVKNDDFNNMLQSLLKHSVTEVNPNQINLNSDIIILDSREKEEYNVSHIPNAKWIGYETFNSGNLNNIPKDSKIIVYCTVGYRSEKTAEKLIKLGYTNVSNLYGGIFEWIHSGKKIISDSITKNVHTYNKEWSKWLNKNSANAIY